jgi:hypothetical protein
VKRILTVVAENNAAVGRGGQDLQHRARQEDERVSTLPRFAFAAANPNLPYSTTYSWR